jgi:hypothetical protein
MKMDEDQSRRSYEDDDEEYKKEETKLKSITHNYIFMYYII